MTNSTEAPQTDGLLSEERTDFWANQGIDDPAMTLEQAVLNHEEKLIAAALKSCNGSISRAAKLLGTTHQGLAFIISGRQQGLLSLRRPIKRRRKRHKTT